MESQNPPELLNFRNCTFFGFSRINRNKNLKLFYFYLVTLDKLRNVENRKLYITNSLAMLEEIY